MNRQSIEGIMVVGSNSRGSDVFSPWFTRVNETDYQQHEIGRQFKFTRRWHFLPVIHMSINWIGNQQEGRNKTLNNIRDWSNTEIYWQLVFSSRDSHVNRERPTNKKKERKKERGPRCNRCDDGPLTISTYPSREERQKENDVMPLCW